MYIPSRSKFPRCLIQISIFRCVKIRNINYTFLLTTTIVPKCFVIELQYCMFPMHHQLYKVQNQCLYEYYLCAGITDTNSTSSALCSVNYNQASVTGPLQNLQQFNIIIGKITGSITLHYNTCRGIKDYKHSKMINFSNL